jgi:hypothetical protein
MDARVVIPTISWVLAELVRYSSDSADTSKAMSIIDDLTIKVYPNFENIDGRTYLNYKKAGAPDVALLLLYDAYPKRLTRDELIAAVIRHGHKASASKMAVHRLGNLVDEADGTLKLRATGRQKAEEFLRKKKIQS